VQSLEQRVLLSSLPAPVLLPDFQADGPPDSPPLPAGFEPFNPQLQSGSFTAASGAPAIATATQSGEPNDTLSLTGDAFSAPDSPAHSTAADTRFLTFGQTTSGNGSLLDASIQDAGGVGAAATAAITLDPRLPADSMYLLWPVNADGAGVPVAVNRTEAWWVGPDQAAPGATVSVFGRNLSLGNAPQSWVYLEPTNGSAGQWAQVTAVNPYKVDFVLPANLPLGGYQVWAHNGHGGKYGWSGPLTLNVVASTQWSGPTFNVRDFGAKGDGLTDDSAAIHAALAAGSSHPNSTIYFPAGNYLISQPMDFGVVGAAPERLMGDGQNASVVRCSSTFTENFMVRNSNNGLLVRDMGFDSTNTSSVTAALFYSRFDTDLHLENVSINAHNQNYLDLHGTRRVFLTNCDLTGSGAFLGTASQLFIDNIRIRGRNDANVLLYSWGGSDISITNTTAQDDNQADPAGWAVGRLFTGSAIWGTEHDLYLAQNTTIDLGVRPGYWDQNSGEQIGWEGDETSLLASPLGATPLTVTVANLSALPPGGHVTIVAGKGLGQSRDIVGFDASTGTMTVDHPWTILPDPATSKLAFAGVTERVVVYDNHLNGKPEQVAPATHTALSAVESFGGSQEVIVDSNAISNVRSGVFLATVTSSVDSLHLIDPVYDTLVVNNTFTNTRWAINAGASDGSGGAVGMLGTVVRENAFNGAVITDASLSTGDAGLASGGVAAAMTILDHNTATGAPAGVLRQASGTNPSNPAVITGLVLCGNVFNLGAAPVAGSQGLAFGPAADDVVLHGNQWTGYEKTYVGLLPGAHPELPLRMIDISVEAGAATTAALPVWNSGPAAIVPTTGSDSSWLTDASPALVAEGNAQLTLSVNAASLAPGVFAGEASIGTASGVSGGAIVELTVTAPPAPTGLTATALSDPAVVLAWVNHTAVPMAMQIDRSTAADFSRNLVTFTAPAGATGYTDTTAASGTTYYYRVRATTTAAQSDPSLTVSVTVNASIFAAESDIGPVSLAGSSSLANGIYTVTGAGADIGGTSDSFHYVYQTLSGDGQIVVRVTGVQNTSSLAKAGIMIRASLAANAPEESILLTRSSGILAEACTGTKIATTTRTGLSAPYWLKLVRSGGKFQSFISSNGTTWSALRSDSISMPTTVDIGLAVTSHNPAALNSATFDHVTVTPYANLALKQPASASTTASGSSPAYAIDGANSTTWNSNSRGTQWLTVDLGAVRSLSRIMLTWGDHYAKAFKVQTSNDNATWSNLYSTTAGGGGTTSLPGLTASCRYLWIYLTAGRFLNYGISELAVYGM
jgi:hypothetical protein